MAGVRLGLNKVKAAGTQGTAVSNCSLLAYPPQQPTLPTLSADKGERGQKKWLQVTLGTRVLAPGTTDRTGVRSRYGVVRHPRLRADTLVGDSYQTSSLPAQAPLPLPGERSSGSGQLGPGEEPAPSSHLPIPPPPPRGRAGKPVGSWLPAARVWSRGARGSVPRSAPEEPRGANPHLPRARPALRCARRDLVPHLRVSEPQPARHAPGAAPRPRL